VANTKQSRLLDHQRKALRVEGRVIRNQETGTYRLVTGSEEIPLGERWREALAALQERSPSAGQRR